MNVHVKKNHNNNNEITAIVAGDDAVNCEAIEKGNRMIDDKKSYSDQMNLLTSYKMAKMESDGPAAWHCLVCGKSWVDKRKGKDKCRIHMQVRLVRLSLPCTTCKKMFGSMRNLKQHARCQRKDVASKDEEVKKIDENVEKVEEQYKVMIQKTVQCSS